MNIDGIFRMGFASLGLSLHLYVFTWCFGKIKLQLFNGVRGEEMMKIKGTISYK